MNLSSLTLLLTDDCNFDCSYCYQEKRLNTTLNLSHITTALELFLPYFDSHAYLNFTGGEPLLAFDLIKSALSHIQANTLFRLADFNYSLTTNGSLITPNIIEYLNQNKFHVLVSFDGKAQEITRKEGSYLQITSAIEALAIQPRITLGVISVFTSETVGFLAESVRSVAQLNVPEIILSFANLPSWGETALAELQIQLSQVSDFLIELSKKGRVIPLRNYRKPSRNGVFECAAGLDRMTLAADGTLWGCHLFTEYCRQHERTEEYKKFCFGDIDSFIKNHRVTYPEIAKNYASFRMDSFYTPQKNCSDCQELEQCRICPVNVGFVTSVLGKIPEWKCEINKILRHERDRFWERVET